MIATPNVANSTPKDKREIAISLAERGFRVFPLVVDGRKPAVANWPERTSSDPAIVARFWSDDTGAPKHYNIGIATGQGLVVLDFDCKNGKAGMATLDAWDGIPGELPRSLRARTASGGVHVYLSAPENVDLRNTVDKLEPGVDVRAYHGYVIAPGSTIGELTYEWLTPADSPIEPMADDMIERCLRCQGRAPAVDRDGPLLVEPDAPAAIRRTIEWLRDEAPEATQGNHGDETTFNVACMVRDFGVSEVTAVPLIAEHWNETEKVSPPWPADELERKIANAYRYAQNPFGMASAHADFVDLSGVVDTSGGPAQGSADVGNLYWVNFDDAAGRALTEHSEPLIKGLLDQRAFSVMYGESNSGKTFVALDLAYHVAAGVAWNRRKVAKGLVIYLAAEGGRGIFRRFAALRKAKGGERLPLVVVPCPVNMLNSQKDIDALLAIVRDVAASWEQDPALVVVDTLSRVLAGGDENSSTDMGALIKRFDQVRAVTGAHLLVVHHSGKDRAKGARGHSSLRAATDTEIEIVERQVRVTKQRDMDAAPPTRFKLESIELGVDGDGDRITSCVVALAGPGEVFMPPMTAELSDLWASFREACKGAEGRPVGLDAVGPIYAGIRGKATGIATAYKFNRTQKKADFELSQGVEKSISYETLLNRMKKLAESGLVENIAENQWVTKGSENE